MIENFRAATQEEISSLADTGDLGPNTTVLALPNGQGKPDLVVLRQCWEADPVIFAEGTSNNRKVILLLLLEHILKFGLQANAFYFNVDADDEVWQSTLHKIGAESVSPKPQVRFKKVIK